MDKKVVKTFTLTITVDENESKVQIDRSVFNDYELIGALEVYVRSLVAYQVGNVTHTPECEKNPA